MTVLAKLVRFSQERTPAVSGWPEGPGLECCCLNDKRQVYYWPNPVMDMNASVMHEADVMVTPLVNEELFAR